MRRLRDPRLAARILLGVALLVLVVTFAPWVAGARTPVLRDVLGTHRPLKAFGAAELEAGRVPAFNPTWALGQPFRGNPNALPFYPGNLAYLVLPFSNAFALHYAIHPLIALVGATLAARRLGLERLSAVVVGVTYAGSGFALSCLSFYNLLAVVAWLPWVVAGVAERSRRGALLGGLALGLAILAGEPVSTALAAPVLVVVALSRHGLAAGAGRLAAVAAIGALVAAPQIVATLRVLPFTYRFAHGLESWEVTGFGFDWRRLLELVLPLPWGSPRFLDERGYWSELVTPRPPYVWTAYLGVLPLALLGGAWRRHRGLAAVAGGALVLAIVASAHGEALARLTGGLFRYPEKLLLPFTLAAALLVGLELEHRQREGRLARALGLAGALLGAGGLLLWAGQIGIARWIAADLAGGGGLSEAGAAGVARGWTVAALVASALLLLGALGSGRDYALAAGLAQLLSLVQLAPLVVADAAEGYVPSRGLVEVARGRPALVVVPSQAARWEPELSAASRIERAENLARLAHFELHPAFGVERGFNYPLASDLEGMSSPLSVFLERNLPRVPWPGRVAWLRRLGVDAIVRHDPEPAGVPGLRPLARHQAFGIEVELSEVEARLDRWRWPRSLVFARDPREAFWRVATGAVGDDQAVVGRALAHDPEGSLRFVSATSGEIRFEVESRGGLAVLGRTYWPIYRARLEDGTRLPTQPADLVLLGVEVPPGRHTVVVDVPAWPEVTAAILALVSACVCGVGLARWRA